jgi:ABC-type nitrate/sulfonate/bicarbonate transport system substrate-binding protein
MDIMRGAAHKHRRRAVRVMAGIGLLIGAGGLVSGCGSHGSAASGTVNVSYWQQATPLPETILATTPSLRKTIPATLSFKSITSGPAALAAMKTGAYSVVGGVGNPPVIAAINDGTDMKIVWAQYYDFAGLAVKKGVAMPSGLAGKTLGDQVGSSEAFSFYGWLKVHGLLNKVKLVNLTPPAMLAAYKSGAIAGGWVSQPWPQEMARAGGRLVTTSAAMAAEGYPGVNVIAVYGPLVKARPKVIQAYVCAVSKAASMTHGAGATAVLNRAGTYGGGTANSADVVTLGRQWPYWPVSREIGPNGLGTPSDPAGGLVAKTLYKTGQWMAGQGTIQHAPSLQTIASHIDPTFAAAAVAGKCP